MVKIGESIKIIDAHEYNAYEIGDIMIVSEILKSKIIAMDSEDEEHALWESDYELVTK